MPTMPRPDEGFRTPASLSSDAGTKGVHGVELRFHADQPSAGGKAGERDDACRFDVPVRKSRMAVLVMLTGFSADSTLVGVCPATAAVDGRGDCRKWWCR